MLHHIGVCIITRIMSHLIRGVKYRIKSARGIWLGLGQGKCIRGKG